MANTADEEGDNPTSEDFETPEFTESSDAEIEFSNAFEALRDKDVVATSTPVKRVKISARSTDESVSPADANTGLRKLSTCDWKRIQVLEDKGAVEVTLLPDEVSIQQGAKSNHRLSRWQERLFCLFCEAVSRSSALDLPLQPPALSSRRNHTLFRSSKDSNQKSTAN